VFWALEEVDVLLLLLPLLLPVLAFEVDLEPLVLDEPAALFDFEAEPPALFAPEDVPPVDFDDAPVFLPFADVLTFNDAPEVFACGAVLALEVVFAEALFAEDVFDEDVLAIDFCPLPLPPSSILPTVPIAPSNAPKAAPAAAPTRTSPAVSFALSKTPGDELLFAGFFAAAVFEPLLPPDDLLLADLPLDDLAADDLLLDEVVFLVADFSVSFFAIIFSFSKLLK